MMTDASHATKNTATKTGDDVTDNQACIFLILFFCSTNGYKLWLDYAYGTGIGGTMRQQTATIITAPTFGTAGIVFSSISNIVLLVALYFVKNKNKNSSLFQVSIKTKIRVI
jgi:hypothetical protein